MRFGLLALVLLGCGGVGLDEFSKCHENARVNVERDGCELRATSCKANPELGQDGVECWVQMSCAGELKEVTQYCYTVTR